MQTQLHHARSRSHFNNMLPIQLNKRAIKGDTFSPYLFIIQLSLLLQQLEKDDLRYHFTMCLTTCNPTQAYDIGIITCDIHAIQPQTPQICRMVSYGPQPLQNVQSLDAPTNSNLNQPHSKHVVKQKNQVQREKFPYPPKMNPIHTSAYTSYHHLYAWELKNNHHKQSETTKQTPVYFTSQPQTKKKISNILILHGIAYAYYAQYYHVPYPKP